MQNDPSKTRLLVISDIHGHTEGLNMLLKKSEYDPAKDQLYLLGDYIDSDPSTISTLQIVKQLVEAGAKAIKGNQETALLRKIKKQFTNIGMPIKLEAYTKHVLDKEMMEWLESLPLYIEEEQYLFVHAGLKPGVPLSEQSEKDLTEIREEFLNAPYEEKDQTIVFGHTPTFKLGVNNGEIWSENNKINIDTGAKHGCRLTLLDIHHGLTYSCSTAVENMYGDYRIGSLTTD